MTNLDVIIKNGKVVTGAGNPWFAADVGISLEYVTCLGNLDSESADLVIDAEGLFVTPGFIDTHSHFSLRILEQKECEPLVRQGITTALFGQDGFSAGPVNEDGLLQNYLSGLEGETKDPWSWRSLSEYFATLETNGASINSASLVGHGTIRLKVMGFEARKPRSEELRIMCEEVEKAMDEGAMGMSTGLVYPPSMYAETAELRRNV